MICPLLGRAVSLEAGAAQAIRQAVLFTGLWSCRKAAAGLAGAVHDWRRSMLSPGAPKGQTRICVEVNCWTLHFGVMGSRTSLMR